MHRAACLSPSLAVVIFFLTEPSTSGQWKFYFDRAEHERAIKIRAARRAAHRAVKNMNAKVRRFKHVHLILSSLFLLAKCRDDVKINQNTTR